MTLSDRGHGFLARSPFLLIVEDQEELAELLEFDFLRQGHEVFRVSERAKAHELLHQRGFDVVLADVRLPDGNGFDLLRSRASSRQSASFVMFSGYSDLCAGEALDLGAEALFPKPFDRTRLVSLINQLAALSVAGFSPRRLLRTSANAKCSLGFVGEAARFEGEIRNVSRGGVFVMLKESIDPSAQPERLVRFTAERLELAWINPQDDPGLSLRLNGSVRWIRREERTSVARGFGLELDLSDLQTRYLFLERLNQLRAGEKLKD